MKRFTASLLLAIALLLPGRCLPQKLSLRVKQRPLAEILLSIEQQTGYPYFISQEQLAKARPVSLQLESEDLETALNLIFRQQPLSYLIEKRQLFIREKIDSLLPAGSVAASIRPLLRSRVIDVYGHPLYGTSVHVLETTQATASDSLGEFWLEKVADSNQLVFSHIGYRTRAISVSRLKDRIRLYEEPQELPEVVPQTYNGFYPELKTQATGSADVIPATVFNRAVSNDLLDHIDHLTTGVLFNKGDALQTDALLIRGRSSILADARPLIVLDHFPYDGELHNLNPNDFQDVSILKDAAATCLWGARAANGVIVINSRRGTTPTTSLSFNSSFTLQRRPDLGSVNRISSADYIELEKQLFRENPGQFDQMASANLPLTPVMELLLAQRDGLIDPAAADAQIRALKQNDVRRDIRRYLYQPAFTQRYVLDLSGDVPLLNYYLSAGMDQGQSSLVGERQERVTLRSMLRFKLYPGLQFYGGIRYSRQNNRHGANAGYGNYQLNGKQLYPYARLADAQGNALPVYLQYRQAFSDAAESNGLLNWQYKPLDDVDQEIHRLALEDVLIQSGAEYSFSKHAGLELHYQYESEPWLLDDQYLAGSYYTHNLVNSLAQTDAATGNVVFPLPAGSIDDTNDGRLLSHQGRVQLNLQKDWKKGQQLRVHAGFEIKFLENNARSGRIYEAQTDAAVISALNISQSASVSGTMDRFLSYFAQVSYHAASSYYLSASLRKDAANLFGAARNKKAAPFWSLAAAYPWHTLKFRASYGVNGNIARNASAYTVGQLARSSRNPVDYLFIVSGPNDQLSWERTTMLNLGMDFSTRSQALGGSLDLYQKWSDKLMGQAPADPASGLSAIRSGSLYYGNVAAMRGEGIELSLHGKFFRNRPVHWGSTFLLSVNRSIVRNYPEASSTFGQDYLMLSPRDVHPVPGKPLFSIYSYPWQGLNGQTGQPMGLYQGAVSSDWNAIVRQTPLNDMVYHGSAVPTCFGSLLNSFHYRQWELSCLISYQLGYYFRKPALSYSNLISSWSGNGAYALRWQNPGDEAHTQVPARVAPANASRDQFYQYASVNVLKGDHIRLEDVKLSYVLNGRQLHLPAIDGIRLFVYAANIATLWVANKARIDPFYNDIPTDACRYSVGFNTNL